MSTAHPPTACLHRTGCALLLVSAAWAVLVMTSLVVRPLFAVDETRYASVAWEMWVRGEWLVPHLNGDPYHHKPPLLFWLIHAGWWLLGVHDWVTRLVPALAGLGAALLLVPLGRLLWPGRSGIGPLAPWIASTGALWALYATALMFDLLVTLCAEVALLGLVYAWRGRAGRGWPLAALGVGLGLLAKGPFVLVAVGPAFALAPWWMASERVTSWRSWYAGATAALLAGGAIGAAWAVPAAIAGGEAYRQAILWDQVAGRVVESFDHGRPWWWYLAVVGPLLYPWSLWPTLWRSLARRYPAGLDAGERLALTVLLPGLAVFSLVSGKQVHYLLPLFPAVALLFARALVDASEAGLARATWLPAVPAIGLGIAGAVLPFTPLAARGEAWEHALGSAWAIALTIVAVLLAGLARARPGPLAVGLLTPAILVLGHVGVVRVAAPYYDGHPIAERLSELEARGIPIGYRDRYQGEFHFLGRLVRPFAEMHMTKVRRWARANPQGVVVLRERRLDERERAAALHWQPFRGGFVALVPAAALAGEPGDPVPNPR
jgi:4-amino-4-deoxy-L-arabinose transferase-like glycosyltransferase